MQRKKLLSVVPHQEVYQNEQIDFTSQSNSSKERQAICPFHDDDKPSLSVNQQTGQWFCHACQEGGTIIEFIKKKYNLSSAMAQDKLISDYNLNDKEEFIKVITSDDKKKDKDKDPPPLPPGLPQRYHKVLIEKAQAKFMELVEKRKWTREVIDDFEIGWDGERYTIPIHDKYGNLINIRRYKIKPQKGEPKMLSFTLGDNKYGGTQIYGWETIKHHTEVIFCEGEPDRLCLESHGFLSFTVTAGVGSWKPEWTHEFKNKVVHIVFDLDPAGRQGAKKMADMFVKAGIHAYIVKLPQSLGSKGDITDYFSSGYSSEDFKKLLTEAEMYEMEKFKEKDTNVYTVQLAEASKAVFKDKKVECQVTVSGKERGPYFFPKTVTATCNMEGGDKCGMCPVANDDGQHEFKFEPNNPDTLELIACSTTQKIGFIKKAIGIPKACNKASIEELEVGNIEDIRVIPAIRFTPEAQEYVARRVFYLGHGIVPNTDHIITGYVLPEPKRQFATILIEKSEPAQSEISSFELDDKMIESLKIFQPEEWDQKSVDNKLSNIYTDLENNIIKGAKQRTEMIKAFDFTFHSVLSFYFQDRLIERGWLQCLIIGDSGQAKSTVAKGLINFWELGELISGESASFAGLVGGLKQTEKQWFIDWGRLALNDRKACIIDEFHGLDDSIIEALSDMRDSGIASITKVETERTWARVRLIMLANPRDRHLLEDYNYGVTAINSVFRKKEDIRRLDFALTVATGEVPLEVINAQHYEDVPHIYTGEKCRNLILWTWSRKPEQIFFEEDATKMILELAQVFAQKFVADIPLVEGADQRLKIARLAVAVACRTFSTKTGKEVIVRTCHVEEACSFLLHCFEKESMAYDSYSRQVMDQNRLLPEDKERLIAEMIAGFKELPLLCDTLLSGRYFHKKTLRDQLGYEGMDIDNLMHFLSANRMVYSTSGGFRKRRKFIKLLKALQKEVKDNGK